MDYNQASLDKHKANRGKIEIKSKFGPIENRDDLSVAYTPGVAAVSKLLAQDPQAALEYSIKGNTIAVVSDGSAVLGLGNIGPLGALPVMEGKALLFKEYGGVDAYPIVLGSQETEEIIRTVELIAPTFGGINLEDISAPRCFEIERRLSEKLDIPVFHDDQHGTAIVVLAAIINSLKLTGKEKEKISVVISGAGAAGIACTKLLIAWGVKNIMMVDSEGLIFQGRENLNWIKEEMALVTNLEGKTGSLKAAMYGADVFIGVSAPNIVDRNMVAGMNKGAVVLAMANPVPEIMPLEAKAGGALIVGTGRSDFNNQINNLLAFPGVFRGLLDARISKVTDEMKIAAAEAIAGCVGESELSNEMIVPSPLNKAVTQKVAASIIRSAKTSDNQLEGLKNEIAKHVISV
jgi:malate dehydrogenase (oxaloacetate-decarboxylating)